MQRIKIKLPFKNESVYKRRKELLQTAKILTNNQFFTIVEEKHFLFMSYLIVFVDKNKAKIKEKF